MARMFDMRDFTNGNTIYENTEPLLRVEFSSIAPDIIALVSLYDHNIILLDVRNTQTPLVKLGFHKKPIINIAWAPFRKNENDLILCSISDDMHAYIWNINYKLDMQ